MAAQLFSRHRTFRVNPFHGLAKGLIFGGFGGVPGGNTYYDSSVAGNNGTLTNMDPATDWGWSSELGRGMLVFDGTNDFTEHGPVIDVISDFLVSAWFRRDGGDNSWDGILGRKRKVAPYAGWGWNFYTDNNNVKFGFRKTAVDYWSANSNTAIVNGTWYHCAVYYPGDGTTPRLWMNGIEETGLSTWLTLGDALNGIAVDPGTSFQLGRGRLFTSTSEGPFFEGALSDVCVWENGKSKLGWIPILADRSDPSLGGLLVDNSSTPRYYYSSALATTKTLTGLRCVHTSPSSPKIPTFNDIMDVSMKHGHTSQAPNLWNGLIGAWPLQDGEGLTAFDVSGHGNGTLTSGQTWGIGAKGRHVSFDGGTSDYIEAAERMNGLSEVTLACWTYLGATGTDRGILTGRHTTADTIVGMRYDAAGFRVAGGTNLYKMAVSTSGGDADWETPTETAAASVWRHLCMVWQSGAVVRGFIDNVEVTMTGSAAVSGTLDNSIMIGIGAKMKVATWLGNLLLPQVYSRALTISEISQLYSEPWAMFTPRLKYYPVPQRIFTTRLLVY